MSFRLFAATTALGVVALGSCNVYDSSLLTGGGDAGPGTGGSVGGGGTSGNAGSGSGGLSGSTFSGGTSGTGGSASPEGGEAGDDTPTGGTSSGGSAGVNSGGASGAGGSGGTSGTTGGGSGGATGAGAGGTAGAGAGGASNGGAGRGGAGGAAGGGLGGAGAGAGGGGPIVQLTGTATADSEEATPTPHPATHGNDGVTTTRWCAANGGAGHYWTLDLGAVHTLSRFEVMWEYPTRAVGLPYGYVVSVSSDGTTFTAAIDRTTTTDTMQIQSSEFPPATRARHVRITVATLPTGAWASFFEARVFGQ